MVAILARYASRFSVRALDLTVDSSLLWVGALLAVVAAVLLAFVPRLPSADGLQGLGLANGRPPDHRRHEPPAAGLRRDADRRVLRAAGGRQHAAEDAPRPAGGADRASTPARARPERARCVAVRTDARAERGVLQGSDAADHRAAGRGPRGRWHRRPLARRRQLRPRLRVLGGGPRVRGRAKTIPRAHLRRCRRGSSRRSASPSSPAATSTRPTAATPSPWSSSARAWPSGCSRTRTRSTGT